MNDVIERQAAIDALRAMQTYKLFAGDDMLLINQTGAQMELMLLPPAQLGTNLAEVGTDCISRQAAIKAVSEYGCMWMEYTRRMTKDEIAQRALNSAKATMIRIINELPSVQPKPSEAARDIATIIENEKDMRVITDNNLWYQRGYEDGFREGRTRTELLERFDDDLK